jgi:hypothetical protein
VYAREAVENNGKIPFDSVLGTTLIHRPVINALFGTGNYHRELGLSQDIVVINALFGRQSDYLYTDTRYRRVLF